MRLARLRVPIENDVENEGRHTRLRDGWPDECLWDDPHSDSFGNEFAMRE